MRMVEIRILSDNYTHLGEEKWRCVTQTLCLKEEVKITGQHDDISIWESNWQMLDKSVVSLTQGWNV